MKTFISCLTGFVSASILFIIIISGFTVTIEFNPYTGESTFQTRYIGNEVIAFHPPYSFYQSILRDVIFADEENLTVVIGQYKIWSTYASVHDNHGVYQMANTLAAAMLTMSREDAITAKNRFLRLIHQEDFEDAREYVNGLLLGKLSPSGQPLAAPVEKI